MKKTIALLLAVLMILSMVACAANTPAKTEEPATTQTETTTPDTTETEEPAATEEPATEEHEPVTLEVFLAQVDWADAWDELEARFEEQHPWISIEHVGLGADADFLQQRLAANDLPDAIQLNNGVMMNAMVEQNLLTDLTNWECAKVMPKAYADAYTFDGKLVGMCQGAAFSTMFYNMDILNEAGWDTVPTCWDELIQCCKDIKEKTGVYGYMTVNNAGFADRTEMNLTPFVRGFGGDFWTDDLEVKIDSAESIAGVQFFHDMVFEDESVVPAGDQSNFFTGGAACTFNQISQLGNLKDVTWQWGVCKLPGDVSFLGQAAMSANASSKNAELAAELVAYMTSDTCAARVAQYWPPCRHSVLDSEDFLNSNAYLDADQMKNIVASSVLNSRAMSNNINSPSIKIETEILFDKLWTKDADIASILGEIAAVYRANLQ